MSKEFEKYIMSLSDSEYDLFISERIARLDEEEKTIALAREEQKKIRFELIKKLVSTNEEVHQHVFNMLRDMETDECEHGRSYVKHCHDCGKIDHKMFPELFDEDGYSIEE